MNETKRTPAPWFDWQEEQWIHEPKKLLANYADACLIAVAPDLLEACELLLLLIQHETNLPESARNGVTDSTGTVDEGEVKASEILSNARIAIEKATGRKS